MSKFSKVFHNETMCKFALKAKDLYGKKARK